MPEARRPSAIARFFRAVGYGPFGFIQPPVVGFILGTGAFLLRDAFVSEHNVIVELPLLLTLALGSALAFLTAAIAANYAIGRRIRDELELQAGIHAGQASLVPTPRAELPGIDLLARSGTATADTRIRETEARTKQVA